MKGPASTKRPKRKTPLQGFISPDIRGLEDQEVIDLLVALIQRNSPDFRSRQLEFDLGREQASTGWDWRSVVGLRDWANQWWTEPDVADFWAETRGWTNGGPLRVDDPVRTGARRIQHSDGRVAYIVFARGGEPPFDWEIQVRGFALEFEDAKALATELAGIWDNWVA